MRIKLNGSLTLLSQSSVVRGEIPALWLDCTLDFMLIETKLSPMPTCAGKEDIELF